MMILTTDANEEMTPIHDRMPVILEPNEEDAWLTTDDESELESLLDPYAGDDMETYPISQGVNSPENDSAEILEPVEVGEQSGLDEFTV